MKRFMQFSISVLCLAIAALIGFHLGQRTAAAQTGGIQAGFHAANAGAYPAFIYVSDSGDVYMHNYETHAWDMPPQYLGNFFGGQPVPTSPSTLGGVKSKYR